MIWKRALIGLWLLATTLSFGQQKYAQQAHIIRAGVAVLDSDLNTGTTQYNNWAPYVWYNLDLDQTAKPAGWAFDNPIRNSVFEGITAARWSAIITSQGNTPPANGTSLFKSNAPYWEVMLSTVTDAQLASFDVLLVAAHGEISLTAAEREKLHKYMDQGGVLWIDLNQNSALESPTDSTADLVDGFPLPFNVAPSAGSYLANFQHPILSYPNAISLTDLGLFPGPNPCPNGGVTAIQFGDVNGGAFPYTQMTPVGDSTRLSNVYGVSSTSIANSIISVGSVGDGFEVVTTDDLSTNLSLGQANQFQAATPVYGAAIHAAARFVVNMINLVSQAGQDGKGARKNDSSTADLGAPLLMQWNDGKSYTPTTSPYGYSAPSVYKNLVVVSNNTKLIVYKENPGGDGADDGLQDFSLGSSYDEIWESTVSSPISSPTCIEVPNAYNGTVGSGTHMLMEDQIWVEDSSGNLLEWNALGHSNDSSQSNEPPDYTVTPPAAASFDTGVGGQGPYPPTYHDGLLFASDMVGPTPYTARVWIVDPSYPDQPLADTRTNAWQMGGNGSGLSENSAPSTIGYVPLNDGSGGADRVIYFPTQPSITPVQAAGVTSLWFGTKGEVPPASAMTVLSGVLEISPRCFTQSGLVPFMPQASDLSGNHGPMFAALAPHVTLILPSGQTASQSFFNSHFNSISVSAITGNIECTSSDGGAWMAANPGFGVRIDYTVDWGLGTPASTTPNDIRGQLFLDDQSSAPTRRILNDIVLGPQGMLYMVLSSANSSGTGISGGSYYQLQDLGRDDFSVKERWDLYDQHTETLQSVATAPTVLPAVENLDPLISLLGGVLGNAITPSLMQDLTFTSGPVLSNGIVYVAAQGDNGGTGSALVDDTVLLAFNATPPPITINVKNLLPGNSDITNQSPTFAIKQADVTSSPSLLSLNYTELQPSQYAFQPTTTISEDGSNNQTSGVLTVSSLSSSVYQSVQGCLSTSLPVILDQGGATPEQLVYPDLAGSKWSPLLWYAVFTGSGLPPTGTINSTNSAMGPPFVSGSTVYVPTSFAVLNVLRGSGTPSPQGMIFGLSTNIAPNDTFLTADPSKPWQSQLTELSGTLTNLTPNPDFEWPQLTGVQSVSDAAIRYGQAALGTSAFAYGAVGGNGRLFSWSDAGLFGFEKANIYVADSNRVATFDADGNPLWSTDQSANAGSNGAVATYHKLVNPTRAYAMNANQTLVVDPGSNRLAVLDQGGNETRSIDGFTVDSGLIPDGYTSGETAKFAAPRDVLTYTSLVQPSNNHYTNPAPTGEEYWVHYLIADSGNRRIVDIVDRYAYNTTDNVPGGLISSGTLFWHSPTSVSGGKYSYTCVARTYIPGLSGYVISAGIGNPSIKTVFQQGTNSTGAGGVVLFPPTGAPVQITNIGLGPIGSSLFSPSSTPGSELSGAFTASTTITSRTIGDVNSLTAKYFVPPGGTSAELALLFTDSSGVYEINPGIATVPFLSTGWSVDWMLPRYLPVSMAGGSITNRTNSLIEAPVYSVMRQVANEPTADNPLDFVPTFAERLASGDILIANGYSGRFRKGSLSDDAIPFTGEILEINPGTYDPTSSSQNLGFTSASIKLVLQSLTGTRSIVQPLFADRR